MYLSNNWHAVHWSDIGDIRASDAEIMAWAMAHGYVVFTHDLDFGTILATTRAAGPSVIQLRVQDTLPEQMGEVVLNALRQFEDALHVGALVTVDVARYRARVLPLSPN